MKTNKRKRINTNEYEEDVSNLKLSQLKEIYNSKAITNDDTIYKYMNGSFLTYLFNFLNKILNFLK
jgi:hypothetical protein